MLGNDDRQRALVVAEGDEKEDEPGSKEFTNRAEMALELAVSGRT